MRRFATPVLALAALAAHAQPPAPAAAPALTQPSPQTAWLRAHAFELQTVEAGHGFDDLQPLRARIADATIVSLGEPTHGTREAFQLKHRLLEFLVTEMGFTLFSIEASSPEAFRLNDYVLRGEGDPSEGIKGMYFWTWDTQEVLDMVQWMRAYNLRAAPAGRPPVQFTGFDMQTPEVALQIVHDAIAKAEPAFLPDFQRAKDTILTPDPAAEPAPTAIVRATIPIALARGKHLTYSGMIRTQGVQGYAGLWLRVDGPDGKVLAFDNMSSRGRTGTTPWTACSIEVDVPPEATDIWFGMLTPMQIGTAWFDDLALHLGDLTYRDPESLDLAFESGRTPPTGFAIVAPGFAAEPTRDNPSQGDACLRIARTGRPQKSPAALTPAPTPALAREAAESLRRRLETSRAAYESALGREQAEWALHNAEIIAQCTRLRVAMAAQDQTPELQRDYAMAQNVKWLLDQHPGAKAVLWAHNGHVCRAQGAMGAFIEDLYPGRQVVIGFSTSTGDYTAIRSGRGLFDNPLQPPPDRSVEARLDATGWDRLIADLRPASPDDPASQWLTQPAPFRMVGALAMDQQFFPRIMHRQYDLIAHIRASTHSRSLGGTIKKTNP